ncbi:hypothetical protein Tco_1327889, partial [Tanacetum coccineum]
TPHYLPKVREYVLAKPHHVIAPGSSRNSQEESYGLNDMAHNHYLKEARKTTQERNRNSKSSVMHTTSLQNTTNGSKQKPRSNNQTSKSLHVSKSSGITSNSMPLVDHSRNSSSSSDSKHFVCSTCRKCIFNPNHDACITKFLKEMNSCVKVQYPKTRNSNKPVEPNIHTQKPGRQIVIGHRFSPNKSSTMHEKTNTPRSCLRWILTGIIFNTVGLRWVPTGNTFISSTTKVDCEPPNGSNEDITNPYECDQTLNVSAGTLNLSAGSSFNPKKKRLRVWLLKKLMSKNQVPQGIHKQKQSPNSSQGIIFKCAQMIKRTAMASADNTSGPAPQRKENVDDLAPKVVAPIDEIVALEPAASTGSPSSTTIDQDAPSPKDNHDLDVAHMNNDPYFGIPILEVPSDQSLSTNTIHIIVHPDHQISEHNIKWTKDHPLENIIDELARPVSTRLQLYEQALFCYYDDFLTAVEPKTYKDALTQSC